MVTSFQPEILIARGQCKLFAKAHTICNIRQPSETSVELNYNRITALILSIPAFIVCHCFLRVILLSIFEEQNPVLISIS